MAPEIVENVAVVSKLTLAYFKDSNWFAHVDMNMA